MRLVIDERDCEGIRMSRKLECGRRLQQHLEVYIRDFEDHATSREKGAKLAYADKLGVFLFDPM